MDIEDRGFRSQFSRFRSQTKISSRNLSGINVSLRAELRRRPQIVEDWAYARHIVSNVIVCLYLYIDIFIPDCVSVWNKYFMNELLMNS